MNKFCVWQLKLALLCVGVIYHSALLAPPSVSITTTAPGGSPSTGYQASAPVAPFVNGDKIRGHVMFKQGFAIAAGATVMWDADGIVNGPITFLNDTSTLALSTDLRLGTTGTLVRTSDWGITISGNGNSLILGGDVTLDAAATMGHDITVSSDLTIDGQGKTLTLRNSTYFAPATNKTLTLKNLTLVYDERSANSCCFQGAGNYILENVTIRCLDLHGGAQVGLFKTTSAKNVTIRGFTCIDVPNVRVNLTSGGSAAGTFTIDKNSIFVIGKGTALRLGNASSVTITMTDKSSVMHFNGCDFYTGTGSNNSPLLNLTKGTVLFENKVRVFNISYDEATVNTNMAYGFTFGDGNDTNNDVDVRVLGGAYVIVQGCMKYNPGSSLG